MKKTSIFLTFLTLGFLIFHLRSRFSADPLEQTATPPQTVGVAPSKVEVTVKPEKKKAPAFSPVVTDQTKDERLNRLPNGKVEFLSSIKISQSITPQTKTLHRIGVIESILADYRFAYKENPIAGENQEVVAQLMGNNPKNVIYLSSESHLIKDGKLIDQWGKPFFFHALSSKQMDIMSSGPDQKLWTEDDISSEHL